MNINENLAYIVGLLKGDGCAYRNDRSFRVCFDNTNEKLAINFFKAIKDIGLNPLLYEVIPSNGTGKLKQYRVIANSKIFHDWYKELTIEKLRVLLDSRDRIINFLKGFYEAEGSIWKSKDGTICITIHNTDLELLKLIKFLLEKISLNFHLNGPYKNNKLGGYKSKPIYRVQTGSKNNVFNFLNLIKPSIKNLES